MASSSGAGSEASSSTPGPGHGVSRGNSSAPTTAMWLVRFGRIAGASTMYGMSRLSIALSLLGVLSFLGACSKSGTDDPPPAAPPHSNGPQAAAVETDPPGDEAATPDITDASWPPQVDAKWPRGCLIEDVGVHHDRPWLTLACTDPQGEVGALIVIDVDAGGRCCRSVSPRTGPGGTATAAWCSGTGVGTGSPATC